MNWTIERAAAADAGEIMTVQRAAYVSEAQLYDTPHMSALSESLSSHRAAIAEHVVLVARAGSRIVGAVRGVLSGEVCDVGRLVVAPDWHGRGIGRALLVAIEAAVPASRFTLHTGHRSASNLALYKKVGYRVAREERVADTLTLVHLSKARA